jgi:hypothetical protein
MSSKHDQDKRPEYIGTTSFNATKYYTAFAAAIPVLGGAAVAIAKWAGSGISDAVVVGVMGVVAAGLLSMGMVISADVRARAIAKAGSARAASVPDPDDPVRDTDSKPFVEVNVNGEKATVGEKKSSSGSAGRGKGGD